MVRAYGGGAREAWFPAEYARTMDSAWSLAARMAAPWIAAFGVFCTWGNAWAAILVYHAQILAWAAWDRHRLGSRDEIFVNPAYALRELRTPPDTRLWWLVLVTGLTGPVLYFLMPGITGVDLSGWLVDHGLHGVWLVLMLPYLGLVHPWLEQRHWTRLRERTPIAHVAFGGYHGIVLWSLLPPYWVGVFVAVLVAVSVGWWWLARQTDGRAVAAVSHVTADLGIIGAAALAAWT
jgi:hypothetical protein